MKAVFIFLVTLAWFSMAPLAFYFGSFYWGMGFLALFFLGLPLFPHDESKYDRYANAQLGDYYRNLDRQNGHAVIFGAVFVIGMVTLAVFLSESNDRDFVIDTLVPVLKVEEGFRKTAYKDTRGVLTIGYGLNLDEGITEPEGEYLMRERLAQKQDRFMSAWPEYKRQPKRVRIALLDMSYEMGVAGVMGFHDMLAALEHEDYEAAQAAALDSDWARHPDTAGRAKRVARGFLQ